MCHTHSAANNEGTRNSRGNQIERPVYSQHDPTVEGFLEFDIGILRHCRVRQVEMQ